jgi:hypothetical protein
VPETVRLSIVSDEREAEVVCGLLRTEGIRCFHRTTNLNPEGSIAPAGQWRELLVLDDDLPRARELLEAVEPVVEECVRCGRQIDEEGGWFEADTGELEPYCGVCAERVFGPA